MCKWVCQSDQLNEPAGRTSQTDQLDRPAGRISSFYLKPWPVRIFKDFPFCVYIVAASESDEGLVSIKKLFWGGIVLICLMPNNPNSKKGSHPYFFDRSSSQYRNVSLRNDSKLTLSLRSKWNWHQHMQILAINFYNH